MVESERSGRINLDLHTPRTCMQGLDYGPYTEEASANSNFLQAGLYNAGLTLSRIHLSH